MEENKTIFDYIAQAFTTFGIIVLIFIFLGCAVGGEVEMQSSLFVYGKDGFATSTLLQLFALSIIITVGQAIFITDHLIKNMPLLWRCVCFFSVVIVAIILFCVKFQWFPITDGKAWAGFIISFAICSGLGTVIGITKERLENKKMARKLDDFQKRSN